MATPTTPERGTMPIAMRRRRAFRSPAIAPLNAQLDSGIRLCCLRRLRTKGRGRPCEYVPARRLLHLAPLCRSDTHMALEGTLECRFGLASAAISDENCFKFNCLW